MYRFLRVGRVVLVVAYLLLFLFPTQAAFARSPSSGLWVKQVIPKGEAASPFDTIEVRFSGPVQAGSFTSEDVQLTGFIAGTPVQLAPDAYAVSFTPSTGLAIYALTIGPNILDTGGQAMDQDGDGLRGEGGEDAYYGALFATAVTIDAGNTTYDGQYLVIYGTTLTVDGLHAFGGVGVYGAGVINHSATTVDTIYAMELTIGDELYLDPTSKIDVSGKGFLIGRTTGNETTGAAQDLAGGSYGGEGYTPSASTGPANRAYGDYRNPTEPGSGGGSHLSWGAGAGGGVARITVSSATIDGSILANGQNGFFSGDPAGSGGSIRMDVGILSGAGVIAASGGNGYGAGGSGGGGRIAIYYEDMSGFSLANVHSHGGKGAGNAGGAGSVYLKPSGGMGTLRIDTHITANDSTPRALTPLGIPSEQTFQVERLVVAGRYSVAVPERAGLPIQADEVVIESGGALSHRAATTTEVFTLEVVAGSLTIDSNSESRIDVSGKGYLAGRTLSNETTGAAQDLSGGGYGGEGFAPSASTGPTNRVYGDYRNPTEPGSGGGLHLAWGAGSGGGVIKITANSATIDGSVLSNGGNGGFSADPAGSGGSIRLDVGSLSGTGIIAADGGNGYVSGGSGGGGRVAIYYEDMSGFSLSNVQAHGGKGAGNAGGTGSVYLKPSGGMGTLRIDTHITANDSTQRALTPLGIPGEETFQVERLVIAGRYSVAVPERTGLVIQAEEIVIESGGALSHRAATATEVFTLELSTGTLTIDAHSESRIDVTGKGYLRGFTAGNTMSGGAQSRAGGTFGGEGFVPPTYGPTNRAYGDYTNPNVPGSGGGTNWSGAGSGGGVVRITADSATINGSVVSNGGNGGFSADPAGSGGSIRLDVGILSGAGVIAANGGNGYVSGGSGGGGRVAIYYEDMSGFTLANVRTHGGTGGAGAGGVGSVYLKTEGGAGILRIDNHGSAVGSIMPLGNPEDTSFVADHLVIAGTGTVVAPEHNMPIVANRITLENGGVLTHRATGANEIFSLEIEASELFIDAVSRIDVTGKGYLVGRTAGNTTFGGAKGRAGGTHGGEGFVPPTYGPTNRAYGEYMDPAEPGSGGGTNWGNAGSGGGVMKITADSATIDGSILANGQNGFYGGDPAGSGGSIRLDVGTLSGAGVIAANGGNGYVSGGSGGGGRVAIYYEDMSGFSPGNLQSHGGKGAGNAGGAGSVYLKPSNGMGTLRIDTHITVNDSTPRALTPLGIPSDAIFQAERLVIAGRYSVAVPERAGLAVQAEEIVIESGGALSHRAATATEVFALEVTTGTLTIDGNAESRIDVSGKGYPVGRTDGNTAAGGATGTSGGSYGGRGFGAQSNDTYGDPLYPHKPGSGGGSNWTVGGAGGGVTHIYAQAISVEGSIKANGGDGFFGGDTAGSGGSILISTATLDGTGIVTASGGKGYVGGGSGGGGRIAVYLRGDMTLPQANITAAGGTGGAGPGEEGTVSMPEEPVFLWVDRDKFLFHDAVTLEWIALGLDLDEDVFVDVHAQGAEQSFSLASGVPGSGDLVWDTTKAPDGLYQLHAAFKNSLFEELGEAVRTVLVNNSVTWHSGEIVNNETWATDEVHLVEGDVTIAAGKTLTVEPGLIVKFSPGTRLIIQDGAALQGEGTETQPITFTSLADDEAGGDTNLDGESSKPQPGDWLGFTVQGDGVLNLTGSVEVRYSLNEHSGTLGADETWLGKFLHHVTGPVTVPSGVTLTIEPGAVVKFNRALGITLQPGGRLVAEGNVAMPIVFTSALDDAIGGDTNRDGNASSPAPGDWKGIHVLGGEANLAHVVIDYAGGTDSGTWNNTAGAVVVQNGGSVRISSSIIRDPFFEGIIAWGSGTVTAENTLISGAVRGVNADGSSSVRLINCTLDDNQIGIWGHGGTLEITNTIISNSLEAGIDNILTSPIAISHSNVWSENGSNYVRMADRTGSNGNLSVDPLYRSALSGNYRLGYLSPMIDAADGTKAPETDFMGAPRYDDPRSPNTGIAAPSEAFADMGAFEFVESAQSDVDLVVNAVNLPAEPGTEFTVTWQVRNQGVGTARGSWYDAIYLSSDKLWTPDDILLATQLHSGDVGPGQSYTNTGEVVLPQAKPGHYYVLVRTNPYQDLFEGVNQYNNTRASSGAVFVDLPSFAPGGAVTGSFQQEGDVQYFELLVADKQDLSIELSGPQGAFTELYLRRGELPTLQDFQWRSIIAGSTNQYLSLNDATPGSYFVMVTASSLSAPGEFNLSARTSEFSIRGVRPEKGGNGGKVTITIDGALFDGSTKARLIDSGGSAVEADPVYFADSGTIAATFDLSGCALGMADVQVVTGESVTTTLSRGFEILPSIPGTLSANVDAPAVVRAGRDFKLYVEYLNVGLQDLVAPILRLRMPASIAAVGLSPQMEDATSDLWMIAVNSEMPAGILPPGARGRITVFGRTTTAGNIHYSLDLSIYGSQQIDWAAMKSSLRPADMTESEWDLLFARIQEIVGQGWDDYKEAVSEGANLLTPLRGAPSSLYEIFQLIVDQALAALKPSVYGTAFLADGNHPLPNARLTLWDSSTDTILTTVTLRDGTYLFPDVPGGSYSVEIEGYSLDQPITVNVAEGDVVVPDFIAREQTYAVSGKVFTLPDGMPVPNQLVALVESAGASYNAVTVEDGSYRVEGLPAGIFSITASHEYLGAAEVWDIRLEPGTEMQTVHLGLSTGSSISGTLTGVTGDFPAGSSVYAVDQTGRVRGVGDVTPAGVYSITGLMGGVYDLFTHVPGTVRQRVEGVFVGPQSFVTGINMALTAAGSVEGTLSGSDGAALPYQFVIVAVGDNFYMGAMSDGEGHFVLSGLAPGIYSVRAQVIGYLPVEASVMFEAGGTALVDLIAAPAAVIEGTVLDGEGNPLIGAVVAATGSDGNENWAVTDEMGRYEIGDLHPGAYEVYVGNPDSGAMSGKVSVVAGSGTGATADFVVELAGKIMGMVMEADGTTPVAGATVQLFKDGLPVGSTATDEDGAYAFQLLVPGVYAVGAFATERSFTVAGDLFVGEGSKTVVADFEAGAQSQTGQVLFEQTGNPLPAAIVSVYQELFPGVYELVHETVSDGQGTFSVGGLAPGKYRVMAEKAGSSFAEGEFIIAQAALRGPMDYDPDGSLTLSVGPSSSLSGQILNDSDEPLAGAEVMITYPDADRIIASGAGDEGGNYAIHGLPGGNFDAIISAGGHGSSKTPVIVVPGGAATLNGELGLSGAGVSGKITAGGGPVSHALVVARDDKNRPLEMGVTGQDGTFVLDRMAPGSFGIKITSEGNTPVTGVIDLPPDVIIDYQREVQRAANDPNSPMNRFLREFNKNIEWLRNLGPRGLEWLYKQAYQVEKDKRHPTIVPDAALDYCKPHRAHAVRMTEWADLQFALWQEAQINSMSLVNNAERVCQWLILGKEVALVFLPLAEKVAKLDKTLKTMKKLRNVQRWYSMSKRFESIGKLAQRMNNMNNFIKGLTAIYDRLNQPEPADPAARRSQADGFLADMNDIAGTAVGHASEWAETARMVKEFEQELKLAGQATSEVLFVLGELSGILSIAMQAETAWSEWIEVGKNIASSRKDYENRYKEYQAAVNRAYNAVIMLALCNQGVRIPPPKPPGSSPIGTGSFTSNQAIDPNEKTGPAAWGAEGFIQAGPLTYRIDFENDPKFATAAAQEVFITDELDENLDLTTFEFRGFGFSNRVFEIPLGLSRYWTTVDLRPESNLVVDVFLLLDPLTRTVSATFRSLDPHTGLLTEDPAAGFLPVNNEQHDGEGFVEFSIRVRSDLGTGSEIRNLAEIVFDVNDPIVTNEVRHTLDSTAPISRVGVLPAAVFSRMIPLNLSGSDAGGSGIQFYDIYVSDKGGPFTYWRTTSDSSVAFVGECGHHYAFYTVAVDLVGNTEDHPTVADATTEVLSIMGDTDGSGGVDMGDIIFSLQAMSKLQDSDPGANVCADVNGDGIIGVEEVIYALQWVSELR